MCGICFTSVNNGVYNKHAKQHVVKYLCPGNDLLRPAPSQIRSNRLGCVIINQQQSVPEGPADKGKTYSVNHRQTGHRFEGNEGKCSRGKWSEIQNVNF